MGEPDLARLQRFLADAVRATSAIDGRSGLSSRAREIVSPGPRGMTPEQRLEVYREQFWIRHLKNLEEDYPTLIVVLGGRDAFRELAIEYVAAFPPRTWDLQRLGEDIPRFVAGHPRWSADAMADDAARLDWAFMEAFDAPDAEPFDPRVLASTPEEAWPRARLDFHPSLRMLSLRHPVHELRERVQRGDPGDRPPPAPTHVVVYRDERCFLRSVAVEPLAAALVDSLLGGGSLGDACESVARASGLDPAVLGAPLVGWFQQWTASGWIRGVRF